MVESRKGLVMKIPRVRFTVRRMMVAVAIVAVSFGGGLRVIHLRRLAFEYAKEARFHFWQEKVMLQGKRSLMAELDIEIEPPHAGESLGKETPRLDRNIIDCPPNPFEAIRERPAAERRVILDLFSKGADYHASLRRKYEHASRHPWLPVEPDPTEPK
jgi:hypothetical protein